MNSAKQFCASRKIDYDLLSKSDQAMFEKVESIFREATGALKECARQQSKIICGLSVASFAGILGISRQALYKHTYVMDYISRESDHIRKEYAPDKYYHEEIESTREENEKMMYLAAEVTKLRNQVQEYKDKYDHLGLQKNNDMLRKQNKELQNQVDSLKKEYDILLNVYHSSNRVS